MPAVSDCFKPRSDADGESISFLSRLFGETDETQRAKQDAATSKKTKELAAKLDVDKLGNSFGRFAGADAMMDKEEFEQFTKASNITRSQASALWHILDRDGSGQVSLGEFSEALHNMQSARAWLRYCPECIYMNTCPYCQECNADCPNCTENAYCASCWADHPARHKEAEADEAAGSRLAKLGTSELLRTHLLIRPLNWAYSSEYTAWMPVAQKARLRQLLRAQQQKIDEAVLAAQLEEEAALQQTRAG